MDTHSIVNLDESVKNQIGKDLALKLAEALQHKQIGAFEAQFVSKQILEKLPLINTREELKTYVAKLNEQWPLFEQTLLSLQQQQETQRDESAQIGQAREEITNQTNHVSTN